MLVRRVLREARRTKSAVFNIVKKAVHHRPPLVLNMFVVPCGAKTEGSKKDNFFQKGKVITVSN